AGTAHCLLNVPRERPSKIRQSPPYNPRIRDGSEMALRLLRVQSQREGRLMMPNASRQVVLDEVKLERYRSLLASTAIFRGCSPAAIDDLARRLQLRTRPAETIIVAQDEPGDSMFVIAAGRVKVALFGENGRELTLSELKPGDFFGEMSLLDNRPRSANVVAVDDATLLVLTRDAFVGHLKAHPQTAINLLSEMTR